MQDLDLFGAPASISITVTTLDLWSQVSGEPCNLPHVRRGLNGGNELQSRVCQADDTNDGSRNDTEPTLSDNHGADEDVDYIVSVSFQFGPQFYSQIPRPRKENIKEA